MKNLEEHPTVARVRSDPRRHAGSSRPGRIDAATLRRIALEAGADDVGLVEIDRPAVSDQKAHVQAALPMARTLISYVLRMNRQDLRAPTRSVANLEFHHAGDEVNQVGRRIVRELERRGIAAVNPAMGFPMEMDQWPARIWVVSHKPVAVAAGLGRMGIHRNVIHPKFGNHILIGTVITEAESTAYSREIDYNPCLECKLCVAACPTGAIKADGAFDFSACYTHNYREFMSGFSDWVETVAESRDAADYRGRVRDSETVSMWQSLGFGPNYKAAYCLAVCPAGEDVIAPFLDSRAEYLSDVVRPLQEKQETVYVVAGSDAERHVARRFPAKQSRRVHNGLRPRSIRQFLDGLPRLFQREAAASLDATYHFRFTGAEQVTATVTIREGRLSVEDGQVGAANLSVTADARTWLRFVGREASIVWAILLGKVRLRGSPRFLLAFGRCFPS